MRPDNCIELVPFGRVVILNMSSASSANCCTKYKHYGIQIQILQNTNINANICFLLAKLSSQASPGQPTATFCANCGTQYSRKLAFKFFVNLTPSKNPLPESDDFHCAEAQKPKTFRRATFYRAKTFRTKRMKPFLTTSIKSACLPFTIIWENPDNFETVWKMRNHLKNSQFQLEMFGQY